MTRRARFGVTLLKPRYPRTLTSAFSDRAPGRSIHRQVNGTRKQACTHPGTTGIAEKASDDLSELNLASREMFQWSQTPPDESSGPILGK
ncbi:hypothetical protein CDL15_Pgr015569 [Punica granatum]|uniref:Uncharacterized protein n=1 Tax=Punica granatum TaxID=22663 RepID=A0A218X6H4_PUNGR|nr:hypothetical protein CDL15_Pgr015569 [Punica granatum]